MQKKIGDGTASRKWSGKTKGGNWGQNFLIRLVGLVPLGVAYAFLDAVLPFYLLFSPKGFTSSRNYFVRRFGDSRVEAFVRAYATNRKFGQMMFDRFRFYTKGGAEYKVTVEDNDKFLEAMDAGKGFVIAGSHVGSMEMAGYMLGLKDKPVNAVIYGGEEAAIQNNRSRVMMDHGVKPIMVSGDMSHLFAVKSALDAGEAVSMPCDRLLGSPKYAEKLLLGKKAKFPIGAFILASMLEKEMICLFSMKEGKRGYRVFVRPLTVERDGKKSSVIADELMDRYVDVLQEMVCHYPEQWFNFFDFWDEDE